MLPLLQRIEVSLFPYSDRSVRIIRTYGQLKDATEELLLADMIQHALMSGKYDISLSFMCPIILSHMPQYTPAERRRAAERLMHHIRPYEFLIDLLENRGVLNPEACDFERYIAGANYYWKLIRHLRKSARVTKELVAHYGYN